MKKWLMVVLIVGGTQKLYHAHGADEFLAFYCYLDFVTHRTIGWSFARTMTLAEGHEQCDFRWKKGGENAKGGPQRARFVVTDLDTTL